MLIDQHVHWFFFQSWGATTLLAMSFSELQCHLRSSLTHCPFSTMHLASHSIIKNSFWRFRTLWHIASTERAKHVNSILGVQLSWFCWKIDGHLVYRQPFHFLLVTSCSTSFRYLGFVDNPILIQKLIGNPVATSFDTHVLKLFNAVVAWVH